MKVNPEKFAEAMSVYWQAELGNVASAKLRLAWQQMALSFNQQIVYANMGAPDDEPEPKQWTVLPIPTGSGKTQGLSLYCAMRSEGYHPFKHPGILIITRMIGEADDLANRINELSKKTIAVSYHSKSKSFLKLKDTKLFPILIITHQAFGNALEAVANGQRMQSNWDEYIWWHVRLIQAMNRVRCRRVIDDKGNCERTEIYLFLYKQKQAEYFINVLRQEMPGIKVNMLEDVPTEKPKEDRSQYGKQIIDYMKQKPPGRYPVSDVMDDLGISVRTMRRLLKKTEDRKNTFAQEMKRIGVRYEVVWGRGAVSSFVKE